MTEAVVMPASWIVGLVVAVFALMLVEAVVIWKLASRAHEVHAHFLHEQFMSKDGLISDLVDKVQLPTPQARVEAAKAAQDLKVIEATTPEVLLKREEKLQENLFWRESRWMNHPKFANNNQIEVVPTPDGESVVLTDYTTEPPVTMEIDAGEFFLKFGGN